jgi:hypothetical protein
MVAVVVAVVILLQEVGSGTCGYKFSLFVATSSEEAFIFNVPILIYIVLSFNTKIKNKLKFKFKLKHFQCRTCDVRH